MSHLGNTSLMILDACSYLLVFLYGIHLLQLVISPIGLDGILASSLGSGLLCLLCLFALIGTRVMLVVGV